MTDPALYEALKAADAAGDTAGAARIAAYIQGQSPAVTAPTGSFADQAKSVAGNVAAGAINGAGNIGATLLAPADYAARALGVSNDYIGRSDRRQAITDGLTTLGQQLGLPVDAQSLPYKAGSLGAELAGTAGVGGALGSVAKSIGAPAASSALASGGFDLGAPAAQTLAGKAAQLAARTGAAGLVGGVSAGMVDPSQAGTGALTGAVLPGSVQALGALGSGLQKLAGHTAANVLGMSTGAGTGAISQAFRAGQNGDTSFLANMRGQVPVTDVLADAKQALGQMRLDRAAAYRNGMAQVSGDKTVLDMTPILNSVSGMQAMGSYKGQVINKNAGQTVQNLADQVQHWASLSPQDFHTPEGLDALKQSIGDIRDATDFGTPARKAADTVYNAIKSQIVAQAPVYAKTMQGYADASQLLSETERALSLGEKASADTSMRKLQSLMRNNVNTNYGNRLDLASNLQSQGGQSILPAIAGQALNSWTPRGAMGAVEGGAGLMGAIMNPHILAAAPFASPRLVGEGAYLAGRASQAAPVIAQTTKRLQSQGLLGLPPASLATTIPSLLAITPSR
ncbi:MAG: hypothetical protein KGH75_11090 [Rhodospirillales bacterium]|nr:hypothetical protein [Rhodospirillales bacterium]